MCPLLDIGNSVPTNFTKEFCDIIFGNFMVRANQTVHSHSLHVIKDKHKRTIRLLSILDFVHNFVQRDVATLEDLLLN